MFRAYSNISDSIGGETAETWTEIKSFPEVPVLKNSPQSYTIVTSSGSETSSEPEIKKIKKSKKRSKKKKKHKKNKYLPKDGSRKLENILCDDEYQKFFSQFSKDEIKKFNFYDQIPQLKPRNAFRLDKKGDPNNLSSEQTYFKFRPKYNEPFDGRNKSTRISKKRLRREMIKKLNQKRYFVRANLIKPEDVVCKSAKSLSESTLTNKMWVYLEMKNDLEEQESNVDLTSDYMKHLNENRHDIDKWFEFIEYQDKALNLRLSGQIKNMSSILFERKKSIFERAISENPQNFHLRMEYLKLRAGSIEMMTQYDSVDLIENEFYSLLEFEAKNDANWKNLYEIWFELIKFFTNNNLSMVNVNRIQLVNKKCFNFFIYSNIEKSPDYLSCLIDLLDNYCGFLRNCGYLEKAIGLFQAIIDFNFTTSSNEYKILNFDKRKTIFELFWDLGLPRFGEKYSQGWLNCMENREQIQKDLEKSEVNYFFEDFLDSTETEIIERKSTRIEYRWLEIENLRSKFSWYPFYARSYIGETQDDCIDPDRLISFDEDINDFLFDLNNNDDLKIKLLLKFLLFLNIVDDNFNPTWSKNTEKNFFKLFNFPNSSQEKKLIEDFVNFIKRILDQSIDRFICVKHKTQITILKWKFEHFISQEIKELTTKESLIEILKHDLSLEVNRSNFILWKNYAMLKYILNSNLKETRKVFNTLLNSSESANSQSHEAFMDIYTLAIDFVELELGIYYQDVDVNNSNVEIKLKQNQKIKLPQTARENLMEILAKNCLYKNQMNQKSKSTFKIGMSDGTRQLLIKRDFQIEYDKKRAEGGITFFLFHKIYSLFLLLNNDIDFLMDLNESIINETKIFKSQFGEFYLKILDYIYHCLAKITKFKFKIKLYSIVKKLILFTPKLDISDTFLNQLKRTLIQFRHDSQSNILVNQLIETNDIDQLFEQISVRIKSGSFLCTLIEVQFEKFKQMVKKEDSIALNSGLENKIRRLLEKAVSLSPKSYHIWQRYFDFEIFLKNLGFRDKISFVFYRSIQNLPFIKQFYLYSVEFMPEKYNEVIMLMDKKELRFLFPIQELNILLEPIDKNDQNLKEYESSEESEESEIESTESSDSETQKDNQVLSDSELTSSSIENIYQE